MRHRVAHRKLGRVTEHRIAILRSQASALIEHERIETTVARAKELRPFVERIISVAKRSLKQADSAIGNVNARRTVSTDIFNRDVVTKLFAEIAPRYADRSGGYTRMLRLGRRRGDDAEIAQVELIGSEFDPAAEVKKTEGEMLKTKNFGRKSLNEIKDILGTMGLSLGMRIDGAPAAPAAEL